MIPQRLLNAKQVSRFRPSPSPWPAGIVNLLSGLSNAHVVCHPRCVSTPSTNRYTHHRFSTEIISHGIWLCFRFCLSDRDVEELLFARGWS
jgi:hypothetical protein